ncbi:MAG: hypothetical protein H8E98_05260 [Bacteroidetes bacterium]|nr:hypothetical protein [Bacteroidota bacterium]
MIRQLSKTELSIVYGSNNSTNSTTTCTWKKSSNAGAYTITAISGLVSGGATFATFYSAAGGNLKEIFEDEKKKVLWAGGIFSVVSCVLTTLATYFASSDCYKCEPNL